MRNKLGQKIRFYAIIALLLIASIVLGYKYLNKNSNLFNINKETALHTNIKDNTLIELITDFNKPTSVAFSNNFKKVSDYSKFPLKEIDIKDFNAPEHKIGQLTRIIVVQNTLALNDSTLQKLLNYVSQGGVLFVPTFNYDQRMSYFYGLIKNKPIDRVFSAMGYFFNTNFLPNIKGIKYGEHVYHGGIGKNNFKDDVTIYATAKNDKEYPTIIENKIGLGSVILFNTSDVLKKQERGLLFSALLKGLEGIPYPIANVNTIFLDDFPSPLYDVKLEPIKSEMDLTVLDFVKDVWWPDMLKLADTFNIKYTAIPAFDYRNFDKPPFLFDQWDTHPLLKNNNKIFVSDFMSHSVINNKHELGLHGYNHISLLTEDWEQDSYMTLALKSAKKKWTISGFGEYPVSYVPPSNFIDSIGMAKLGIAFPSIKYMSSLYLGSYHNGGDREFDYEKWNPNFFNYPRITSGYALNDSQKFLQQSLFIYAGIWNHFVHPDDVYQIPSKDNTSAGNFSLRNSNGLGWRKSIDGKPSMISVFSNYLHQLETIYPLSRYVSAKKGAAITKDWRASNYIFSKNSEEYNVKRTDSDEKGEYFWFLYADKKNTNSIEKSLLGKVEKFSKTPILSGYLYSIKTAHPSLSIKSVAFNKNLTTEITEQIKNEYASYTVPIENKSSFVSINKKPNKNASLKAWVNYYVSENHLADATNLLKQHIDSKKLIDSTIFNDYFKYMSWQSKSKEAWFTLQNHINKHPLSDNIKYSRVLGTKNGYYNETIRKNMLRQQVHVFNDKQILTDYYYTFNTPENKDEITQVLERLLKVDNSFKTIQAYLRHLINYAPKKAMVQLNKYIPSESSSLWDMSEEISWFYANNKRYKKAYDWSKHSQKISIANKLYWLSEIEDFETFTKEYKSYLVKNPNDLKSKLEISKLLLANNRHLEAWQVASTLPNSKQRDTLKHAFNKNVVYLNKSTQKELINKYPNLFEPKVKKEIEKEIRLTQNNSIEAITKIIGNNNNNSAFEKKLTYHIKNTNLNTHSISVTNNDLYKIQQSNFTDKDNVDKNVFGLEYKYNHKTSEKLNYWISGRVEKDKQHNLYYQAGAGVSLSSENNFTSLGLNTHPVKTGPGYQKKIYRTRLAAYQETYVNNIFKTVIYAEGNHYSNNDLEGSITTKLVLERKEQKKFKVLPQLEASYTKSNTNQVKNYPYYLVEKRFFVGGGVGLKYGKEKSNLNVRVEGSTFIDNDFGNFNRFIGQASYKIGSFTKISASAELSTKAEAFSNSLQIGLKHTF